MPKGKVPDPLLKRVRAFFCAKQREMLDTKQKKSYLCIVKVRKLNRETGENPVQSRCCEFHFIAPQSFMPLPEGWEGG